MMTENSIGKYLWMSVVIFVTYLFLGSFIISKNILELVYLIILYIFSIIGWFFDNKNRNLDK